MNIAIISHYLPSTSKMGVGYQVHYMANQLIAHGHAVTVFSLCPKPADAHYHVEEVKVEPPLRSLKMSWRLRNIDWTRFDIIHAHSDDWFFIGDQFPPHVRTMHGSCLDEARHIPGLKNKLMMLWLAGLETLSCLVADRTVGVSKNTCQSYPWIDRFIYNGIDLSLFHPTDQKEQQPTILFVGTYENRKRGKLLTQLFKTRIQPAVPQARLWMVAQDVPAIDGVEILGRPSNTELADYYRRAWVFCLPSTYEGFGVPYIEAMASGTAVAATPNVGAAEVLDGGRFGAWVPDDQLADTLIELLQNSSKRHHYEKVGLQRAKDFDWRTIIQQYEQVYQEVLK